MTLAFGFTRSLSVSQPRATRHPKAIRVMEVGVPKGSAKIDNVPDAFIKAAKKKILAEPPKPKMKDGKPVEVFTYFFYVPGASQCRGR